MMFQNLNQLMSHPWPEAFTQGHTGKEGGLNTHTKFYSLLKPH